MATTRRHGNRAAFWGSINPTTLALTPATVNANDVSAVVGVGRASDQVTFFVDAGAAFTAKIQVAHSSPATGDTVEGIAWDYDSLGFGNNTLANTNWFDLYYMSGDSAGGGVQSVSQAYWRGPTSSNDSRLGRRLHSTRLHNRSRCSSCGWLRSSRRLIWPVFSQPI
jgi:hypothetical protein